MQQCMQQLWQAAAVQLYDRDQAKALIALAAAESEAPRKTHMLTPRKDDDDDEATRTA